MKANNHEAKGNTDGQIKPREGREQSDNIRLIPRGTRYTLDVDLISIMFDRSTLQKQKEEGLYKHMQHSAPLH